MERLRAKGEADLLKFLKEQTGRSESALKKALDSPVVGDAAKKLRAVCGDERLFNRVQPFSGLVRNDTFDRPVVIRTGSVFVTAGTDRRSSGTHYTPRSLTEPIVRYTLEPLVYVGPAEGKPKEEWTLRPAKELLDLKVCDMACGSGRSWSRRAGICRSDFWKPGSRPKRMCKPVYKASCSAVDRPRSPRSCGSRHTGCPRRAVCSSRSSRSTWWSPGLCPASRGPACLYGVDKNPLAVEMAKLSLWLLTLAKDKPFSFLDHAIRCGDSLVGIRDIRQVQYFQLDFDQADRSLFTGPILSLVDEAVALRKKIESLPANTVEDVREKERLLAEAEEKTARLRYAADL